MGLKLKPAQTYDAATAWFAALCLFLSTIEYLIPKPLPFLRLGLANLPLILALDVLSVPSFFLLVLLKILGQALVSGSLFSYIFLFSAVGSFSSAFVMFTLKKTFNSAISCVGLSVAGAFTSNAVQLLMARFYIFGQSAWYIAPPFFALGLVTGTLLGFFANSFIKSSRTFALLNENPSYFAHLTQVFQQDSTIDKLAPTKTLFFNTALFRLGFGSLLIILLFFAPLGLRFAVCLLSILFLLFDKQKIHLLPALITTASIILFNLTVPVGKVIWEGFGFSITHGALLLGIKKALVMEGLLFTSRWMLKFGMYFPGNFGELVSDTLFIFSRFGQTKIKINPRDIIGSIDALMSEPD